MIIIKDKKFVGAEGQSELFELLDSFKDGEEVSWESCHFEGLVLDDKNCPKGTARGDFRSWAMDVVEKNTIMSL